MGEYVKKIGMRRILIMLLGNVFLGMGVSIFKFAGLGNEHSHQKRHTNWQ